MTEVDVRKRLVEALEADLVGPFVPDSHPQGGQEILPLAPSRWYLTGFLAPKGGIVPDVEDRDSVDDGLAAGSESSAEDAGTDEPELPRSPRVGGGPQRERRAPGGPGRQGHPTPHHAAPLLDPVSGEGEVGEHGTCVVHEHIEPVVLRLERLGQ